MQGFLNSAAVFFPLALGLLYGLSYALNGYIYRQELSLFNILLIGSTFNLLFWIFANYAAGELKNFPTLSTMPWKLIGLIFLNALIIFIAWGMSVNGMKHISPTYIAAGEVSYVIFTPIMAWLIFGRNEINLHTAIAGALILGGCAVLIYGQAKMPVSAVSGVS